MIVTVKDLIENLAKYPGTAKVKISTDGILSDISGAQVTIADENSKEVKQIAIISIPDDCE